MKNFIHQFKGRQFGWLRAAGFGAATTLAIAGISCCGNKTPVAAPCEPPAESFPTTTGFQNLTNGFEDQKSFDCDRKSFEEQEEFAKNGLGPVYNHTSCVACHQNPITGSASQISVLRAGYLIDNEFHEPEGGSLIHQRAVASAIQEATPWSKDVIPTGATPVHTRRMATSILGDGLVEVLDDQQIVDLLASQPAGLKGYPVSVPVNVKPEVDAVTGKVVFNTVARLGRFGWKCQEASLINFSAGAYLNEMGITNPLNPVENKSNGRDVAKFDGKIPEPEDDTGQGKHLFGSDVEAFARFMRSTTPPPREPPSNPNEAADIQAGEQIFLREGMGCAVCHHPSFTTPAGGTVIHVLRDSSRLASDLPDSKVPEALGGKVISPYSDFMLHNIGTGDGIAQTQHAQLPSVGSDKDHYYPISDPVKAKYHIVKVEQKQMMANRRVLIDHHTAPLPEGLDQKTTNMIRTAPLWGVRTRIELLHDGSAYSIDEAIVRHQSKSEDGRVNLPGNYNALTPTEKRQLLAFLYSL